LLFLPSIYVPLVNLHDINPVFNVVLQEHPEWEIKDGSVFFQKAKETQPCKEIPSLQVINQTLSYARELERIV
jgi:hypothetical protein